MTAYQERFPRGSTVVIADESTLREFQRTWTLHHPLSDRMIVFAGRAAIVEQVSFYFGGDVMYELTGVPGTWHEQHLRDLHHGEQVTVVQGGLWTRLRALVARR